MTRETLILVGRAATETVAERHAERLREDGPVDAVRTATYESEPALELSPADDGADRTYVVPLCFAHTYETLKDVPRALSRLEGDVRYCDPVGGNPAVTAALRERARAASDAEALLLVGLGNSGTDHGREAADYHADRLRRAFDEVRTAYLLQSPAVECARYAIGADRAVVCPLFVADCDATERRIPEQLELDRGGLDYAAPLGDAPAVTEAIRAEVERERVLAESGASGAVPEGETAPRPVATDGRGDD